MSDPFETQPPLPRERRFADADPDEQPERIGRYRVERVLGEGGFGRVYLAYDEQLTRPVTIKVPHPRLVTQAVDAEAYLAEARMVANLHHPHIVPVFDVGSTPQFPCFVVSMYIDGTDLAAKLKESPLSLHESAALVATVAEALHHAHKQGVVHRDIKPGNLLLDKSGKPFVGDFGLALREQDLGKGPHFAGTPAYMSPEQARGEGHRVDGRSDVYSLGVVFYELLTGRRPFRADSQTELLEQITSVEARPPRMIDDRIPKELERICLKTLAKRPSERYTTAKDFADDLRTFLEQARQTLPVPQPPPARRAEEAGDTSTVFPATKVEQASAGDRIVNEPELGGTKARWKSTRPALIAAGLTALFVVGLVLYRPWEQLRNPKDNGSTVTPEVSDKRQEKETNRETAKDVVKEPDVPAGPNQVFGLILKESKRLAIHKEGVTGVAFIADTNGKQAVSASSGERKLHHWDLVTGEDLWELTWNNENVKGFTLSPDGHRILTSCFDDLSVSDAKKGGDSLRDLKSFAGSGGKLGIGAFSRNGRRVILPLIGNIGDATFKSLVDVVDLETGNVIAQFQGHKNEDHLPSAVVLSVDEKLAASASDDALCVWEVTNPVKERHRIPRDAVICLAFSSDGKWLLAGEKLDALILWDVQTGKQRMHFEGHKGPINCVAFSPDDQRVLSGGDDCTVRLWDVQTGKEMARLAGHEGEITSVAFSPDGKQALTGSADKTVRLWDLPALAK